MLSWRANVGITPPVMFNRGDKQRITVMEVKLQCVKCWKGTWWCDRLYNTGFDPVRRSQRFFWGLKLNIILKNEAEWVDERIPAEVHHVQKPPGEFPQGLSSGSVVHVVRGEGPYVRQIPWCLCYLLPPQLLHCVSFFHLCGKQFTQIVHNLVRHA